MHVRYYGLDFARAVFMLLGIVYHSCLVYAVDRKWRVTGDETSYLFNNLSGFIHSFRMEGFYMIAGFFYAYVVAKYGARIALRERITRVAIPMIFVGLTFNSLMNILSDNRTYSGLVFYIIDGQWIGHLWFIGNLIIYYLVTITIVEKISGIRCDDHNIWLMAFISLIVLPVSSLAMCFIGNRIYSGNLLFVNMCNLYKYLPYFIFGIFCWNIREWLLPLITTGRTAMMLAMYSSILIAIEVIDTMMPLLLVHTLLEEVCNAVMAYASIMVLFLIGNRPSRLVSDLVDTSYTIYLLHQPLIIITFTFFICNIGLGMYSGFLAICTLVFSMSYFFHKAVVSQNRLLTFLFNGRNVLAIPRVGEKYNAVAIEVGKE